MTDDKETIRLLKAEIQDLEDQLADQRIPSVEFMDDLNLLALRKRAMQEALNRSYGNVKKAAEMLGLDRTSLSTYIRRYRLKKPFRLDPVLSRLGKVNFRGIHKMRKESA